MSYQVLARKWRPGAFQDLVGQAHVVRALINALDNDRLHHAYLFTGTRGVGKTTLARIFAKSLNCERGVSSTPCGECSVCREVDEGRFIDLLEVDAASRTKVDQTRELLDNVPYAPVQGRYKVYLIDEVHMFSGGSFNALLKTLEEPPPHVKFLLATTDPQKVPVTVLSRCLQFNLKRLPFDQISDYLESILEREGLAFEGPALELLARGADGSMRDALSLLDQAIAFGGGKVLESEVRTMLGTSSQESIHRLLSKLADHDTAGLLAEIATLAESAPDFAGVLGDLLMMLHRVALAQALPDSLDSSMGDVGQILELASKVDAADIQLFYQIALIGQRDLPLAPDPRSGLEMVLLRMLAFRPARGVTPSTPSAKSSATKPSTEVSDRTRSEPESGASGSGPGPHEANSDKPRSAGVVVETSKENIDLSHWQQVVASLKIGGIASQLASNCVFHQWDGSTLRLRLDPSHQHMQVGSSEQRLRGALEELLDRPVKLLIEVGRQSEVSQTPAQQQAKAKKLRQASLEAEMESDKLVQSMRERFGAHIVPGSIQPVDD